MGKNISQSYTARIDCPLPPVRHYDENVILWNFNDSYPTSSEWGYLNTVDMTLYRKRDVQDVFVNLSFSSPNTLEAAWACHGIGNSKSPSQGLCYNKSKIVNIPLNLVQTDWQTATHMKYSVEELLWLFMIGFRIDPQRYHAIEHSAPHTEVIPQLIKQVRP